MGEILDPALVTLEHIPIGKRVRPLSLNIIGSHQWGTNHAGSDVDSFAIVQEPSTDILDGTHKYQTTSVFKSNTDHGWPIDIHVHEVGRVVPMLERGNINFMLGLLSPVVVHTTNEINKLKRLVENNPCRNIYDSVHGMVVQNMARYLDIPRGTFYTAVLERLKGNVEVPARKCHKMLLNLEWGLDWLDGRGAVFGPGDRYDHTAAGVVESLKDFDIAFTSSSLPAKPPTRMLRDWLLRLRCADLTDVLV